jgi:serine/threonine-protein kinase
LLETGTIVAGYRIDGILGEGGMGVVYRATQMSLMRTVALKVLATELSDDPTFRERFRREGLLQAAIEHPHIVTVYEAGETDQGLFLAMRLVRGPTLKDETRADPLDTERALRILLPVADALDAAHEVGLIHRDVKPQNILIGARDHPYLADFGLTNVPDEAARLTGTGQFIGTIDYVAPEQVRGEGATVASDVYALAGVLYECLTGEVPFAKPTEAAVLYAHMSEPPPKVSEHRPELPAAVDDLIARGMAKDPAARPASPSHLMREAAQAFGGSTAALADRPAVAAPPAGDGGRTRAAPGPGERTVPAAATGADPGVGEATVSRRVGATAAAAPGAGAPTAPAGVKRDEAQAPPAAPRRSRGLLALAGVVLVAAAAAAGAAIGGSGSSSGEESEPAFGSSASAGSIALSFPDDWARVSSPERIPGLGLVDEIALAPEGRPRSRLAAGMTAASGASLLPVGLLRRLDGEPRGEPVRLGALQALRYAGLRAEGIDERLTVFAAPTSGGVATVACLSPPSQAPAFMPECERVAATADLSGEEPLALGPSPEYARGLDRALGRLETTRRGAEARLRRASTQEEQAGAARALARAYGAAAQAVSRVPAGPAELAAGRQIRRALREMADAYGRLARAASEDDGAAYGSAAREVRRAQVRLAAGLRELEALGYAVGRAAR